MRLSTVVMFILSLVEIVVGPLTVEELSVWWKDQIDFALDIRRKFERRNTHLSEIIDEAIKEVQEYSAIMGRKVKEMQKTIGDGEGYSEDFIQRSSDYFKRSSEVSEFVKNLARPMNNMRPPMKALEASSTAFAAMVKKLEGGL
eukprot:GHVS01005498.1.p2 GENE.GHVS01005498.1~~GHVS01005498.1.p2  ORF type:complete len:144 (+),score=17.00 GHVS01005498.1:1653-2084(+)